MTRRARPLVTDRESYQRFVCAVFTGPGQGLREVLARTGRVDRGAVREWLDTHQVSPRALPKDLTASQWASLWRLTEAT